MPLIRFWINSFIPRDVAGYTRLLSKGTHAGKTAIPMPNLARLWPGNTLKHLDAGFLTDQRGFDSNFGASSRMTSMVEVESDYMDLVQQAHTSSGTTQVDLATGGQSGFAIADMSRCAFQGPTKGAGARGLPRAQLAAGRGGITVPGISRATTGLSKLDLSLKAAAGDPLVGMAADIDYLGIVSFERNASGASFRVKFQGKIDAFPAYECYASMNGQTQTLFTSPPPAGNTVTNLLFGANRPVSGSVTF